MKKLILGIFIVFVLMAQSAIAKSSIGAPSVSINGFSFGAIGSIDMSGNFYGPNADAVGGGFNATDLVDSAKTITGSFGGRKQ